MKIGRKRQKLWKRCLKEMHIIISYVSASIRGCNWQDPVKLVLRLYTNIFFLNTFAQKSTSCDNMCISSQKSCIIFLQIELRSSKLVEIWAGKKTSYFDIFLATVILVFAKLIFFGGQRFYKQLHIIDHSYAKNKNLWVSGKFGVRAFKSAS